jgi:hypothetical protein
MSTLSSVTAVDGGWAARARREPAEYVCKLAESRVWQDEQRFIRTVPAVEEAAPFLGLDEAFAHALVIVLSQLPRAARRPFADAFYARRAASPGVPQLEPRTALAAGAAVALLVVELTEDRDLEGERVLDLLRGAAQGDDLSRTPPPALVELGEIVARIRAELERGDESTARAAAAAAVAEVLDPASGVVALTEVLVRASWAAVRSWEPARVLSFLLELDRIVAEASG